MIGRTHNSLGETVLMHQGGYQARIINCLLFIELKENATLSTVH